MQATQLLHCFSSIDKNKSLKNRVFLLASTRKNVITKRMRPNIVQSDYVPRLYTLFCHWLAALC